MSWKRTLFVWIFCFFVIFPLTYVMFGLVSKPLETPLTLCAVCSTVLHIARLVAALVAAVMSVVFFNRLTSPYEINAKDKSQIDEALKKEISNKIEDSED